MTAAHDYEDLHRLVDRSYAVPSELVVTDTPGETRSPSPRASEVGISRLRA
ncbi:hypothetical protein ACQP2U_05100 [Nocardia sp. CA-084685]|uniref:hypothetical protein n=1 Tax=Nocardia sp. CA-084685 TaxID=3239970 RepID=UPI003D959EC5